MKRTEKVIQIDNSTISAGRYDKFSRGTQTFLGTWGKSVHCQTQDPQLVNIGIQTQNLNVYKNAFVQTTNKCFADCTAIYHCLCQSSSDHSFSVQSSLTSSSKSTLTQIEQQELVNSIEDLITGSGDNSKTHILSLVNSFLCVLKGFGTSENLITLCLKVLETNKLSNQSPLYNLIFDQFKFLLAENTSCMRYSQSTKCIFKVIKDLFGGAVLRFLSGFKNENQVRCGKVIKGYFCPQDANIILAVPSESVLDKFHPLGIEIPRRIKPGVISDFIEISVETLPSSSSIVLKFDGRRIRPGFEGDDIGDIDLGGLGSSTLLADNLHFFDKKIEVIKEILQKLQNLQATGNNSLDNILPDLFTTLDILNNAALSARKHKEEMERKLIKYQKLAGSEWIKTKYKKIISFLSGLSRKTNEILQNSLNVRNTLSAFICKLQNSDSFWTDNVSVPLSSITNCHILKENIIDEVPRVSDTENVHLPVKQRSTIWHDLRSQFMVTGSTLFDAAGFGGLSNRRSLFDHVHIGKSMPTPSEEVQKAMAHGSKNEINAIATICTKVLPVYFPQLDFVEVGVFRNPSFTSKHTHVDGKCSELLEPSEFSLFSLDGIFIPRKSNFAKLNADDIEMCTEIKCPYFKKIPHLFVPERYMPQLQSGIFVTNFY